MYLWCLQIVGWQHRAQGGDKWTAYSPRNSKRLNDAYLDHRVNVLLNPTLAIGWKVDLIAMKHTLDPAQNPPVPPRTVSHM